MSESKPQYDPDAKPIYWPEKEVSTERMAIIASGGGTTFEAIAKAWQDGRIEASSMSLIATEPKIGAIKRAEDIGIPWSVVDLSGVKDHEERGDLLKAELDKQSITFAHSAGLVYVIKGEVLTYDISNTHPAPMPDDPKIRKYGGYKKIGEKVHQQVAADHVEGTAVRAGSSVHLVDPLPDHGPMLRVSSYDIAARAEMEKVPQVTWQHIQEWTMADEKPNNVETLATISHEGKIRRLDDVSTADPEPEPTSTN